MAQLHEQCVFIGRGLINRHCLARDRHTVVFGTVRGATLHAPRASPAHFLGTEPAVTIDSACMHTFTGAGGTHAETRAGRQQLVSSVTDFESWRCGECTGK